MSSKPVNTNPLTITELVYQITFLVKNRNDFQSAANIMIQNNMTLNDLCQYTYKLNQIELASLADKILLSK